MKTIYTFLLLLCCTTFSLHAQTYKRFPSSNTIWGEIYRKNADSSFRVIYYGLLNNDTVINGYTYHKLYQSADTLFQEAEYYGAIRDDSASRKVYFMQRSFSAAIDEQLLFDFSLNRGDTLKGSANNGRNNWHTNLIVANADSVLMNGYYRKRISFNAPYPSMWVEGMGNIVRGLMFLTGDVPFNGTWAELVCMRQDNRWWYHRNISWLYQHTFPARCEDLLLENTTGVDEIALNNKSVRFYPNPVTGQSYLDILEAGKYETLELYNIAGARLSSEPVAHKSRIAISRESYTPGIYFYRLTDKSGASVFGRFSIQ